MPRAVYSAPFILYTTEAPNATFDVPEGFTAVIRDFTVTAVAGAATVYLRIQDSVDAPLLNVAVAYEVGLLQSSLWQGRVVVPYPGIISVSDDYIGDPNNIYVGGYLLRND